MKSQPIDFLGERQKRRPGGHTPLTPQQQARERQQREMCPNCGCPQETPHEPINQTVQLVSGVTSQEQCLFVLCQDQQEYVVRRKKGEVFLLSRADVSLEGILAAGSAQIVPDAEPKTASPGVPEAPGLSSGLVSGSSLAPSQKKEQNKKLQCSCCERPQAKAQFLIDCRRRNIFLCNYCIEGCNEILQFENIAPDAVPNASDRAKSFSWSQSNRTRFYCSLCGKEEAEVARLIAMHAQQNLFICNGCVGVCNATIAQNGGKEEADGSDGEGSAPASNGWQDDTGIHRTSEPLLFVRGGAL